MTDLSPKRVAEFIAPFRVEPGRRVRLPRTSTRPARARSENREAKEILTDATELLAEYQMRLAAQDTYGVVIVLQAMDAAGKDGTIRHVMSGVNPQGVQVSSFKIPSAEELDHDFLWRYAKKLPERGHIGIFNRSHYEEVLVVRVHPRSSPARSSRPAQGPRHLEPPLPRDQRLGALPRRPGLPLRQALPEPLQRGAAQPVPGADRRAGEELEVLRQRRQGARLLGRLPEGVQRRPVQHEHGVGAVVRDPGRRQVVRAGGRGGRPRPHPDRDQSTVPQGQQGGARRPPGHQGRARGAGTRRRRAGSVRGRRRHEKAPRRRAARRPGRPARRARRHDRDVVIHGGERPCGNRRHRLVSRSARTKPSGNRASPSIPA